MAEIRKLTGVGGHARGGIGAGLVGVAQATPSGGQSMPLPTPTGTSGAATTTVVLVYRGNQS